MIKVYSLEVLASRRLNELLLPPGPYYPVGKVGKISQRKYIVSDNKSIDPRYLRTKINVLVMPLGESL